ncbi:MAG: PorV/PorQ family protein [Candidatus Cloacimonetes bacterium]|nr:PorV/PorQ family protein [Candidatus Cloacimonadota bacterium]
MRKFNNLRIKYVLNLAFSLLLIVPLFAQHQDAGTTGFANLKLVYSARANSMGSASTGRSKNFDGMQFNPASILRLPEAAISSTFMDHFVGSGGGSLQYVVPKNIYHSYGLFINYWNSGEIDRTDISSSGELIELNDTFGAQNIVAGVSYARFISPAIDVGGNVKFIWDQIDESNATAAVVDLGLLHHTANDKIKVGLSMRNLGAQISKYSESKYDEKLPTVYSAGMGFDFTENTLMNLDISKAAGDNFIGKFGIEHKLNPALSLRTGFRSNAGDYNNGGSLAWTSGLSLGLGWNWKRYTIDYSLASYGDLGLANQLSIRYGLNTGFLPSEN